MGCGMKKYIKKNIVGTDLNSIAFKLFTFIQEKKSYVTVLSCLVVFITTYLLILPAITLDQDEAEKQGGIDLKTQQEQLEDIPVKDPDADTNAKAPDSNKIVLKTEPDVASGDITYAGKGYEVSANCDRAGLPEGTELVAEEINKSDQDYEALYEDALKAVQKDSDNEVSDFAFAKFYDISLLSDGEAIEPDNPIDVTISYEKALKASDAKNVRIVHFAVDKETGEIEPEVLKSNQVKAAVKNNKLTEITFEAASFSLYALLGTEEVKAAQITEDVLTADGKTFKITVAFDDDAEIPEGSHLETEEFLSGSEQYEKLLKDSAAALGTKKKEIGQIRFFDIKILNGDEIIEPKKPVTVEIHYDDPVHYDESLDYNVIHFGSEGTEVFSSVVKANEDDQTVQDFTFQTESFSTFAITSTPSSVNDLVGNEYVLYIKPGNDGAVLSPESHPSYNNRLRAIPANSDGVTVTSDEDNLPVWKITNGSQNGTYRLSTTYNNQTVYINFDNQNGGDWDGHLRVSTTPQDLRIRTRNLSNGGTQFRFTFNTDNNAVALDLFGGDPSNGFSVYNGGDNNNNEYFNLYKIGEPIQNKVTVRFVDRKGNLLTDVKYNGNNSYVTKNEDGTFTILNDWHGSTGTISLENDFGKSRYTYANTHLAKDTTSTDWPEAEYNFTHDGIIIEPTFTSTGHALQFKTEYGGDRTQGNTNENPGFKWYDFADSFSALPAPERDRQSEYAKEGDKVVYVIMDPYPPASSMGGNSSSTGEEGSEGNVQSNNDPIFHKDMVNNHDGTYELSLSVVGKAFNESETPKANVLLVVDTSSSMESNKTDYEDDNGQMVHDGTRMEATQVQLRKLGQALLGRNNLQNADDDDDDIVEVAMVTFDGDAYPDTLDWTTSYDTYQTAVNGLETHRGTDWEDALDAALGKAQKMKKDQPNEPVYVLFFTDGEPSQYRNFHGTWGLVNGQDTGSTGNSRYGYRYFFAMYGKEASKDEARAIVSTPGIQLYTMFAFGPTGDDQPKYYGKTQFDLLHDTVKYAYNTDSPLENKYAFNSTDSTKLNEAFDEILRQISSSLGISDVVMNDSFTSLTVPGVNNPDTGTGGFRYWQIPAGGTWEDRVAWNEDEAPHATYSEETGVQWDLGDITLQNDVTYVVTFTVWPSQEAYDWVADLKNGVRTWEQAKAADLADKVIYRTPDGNGGYNYDVQTNPQSTVPDDGSVGTNGITYTKTEKEIVYEQGQNSERTYNPNTHAYETTTYTDNDDGTWTKTIVSEVITAFNMPDKRMELTNTDFNVEKFWDVNGKLTELHNFLYHKDKETGQWVSNEKNIIFKISKGYDANGNPKPYDKFGTDGLSLGWQAAKNKYDWVGRTTTIEGHEIGTRWQEDLDISFGLMLTERQARERGLDLTNQNYLRTIYQGVTYYLLDYGWDYAIDEVNGLNYHPMLIDGQPAHVKFTVDNGVWTITEMEKDLTALTGNNILRSELRVQKELLDIDGNRIRDDDTTTFEFTINLVNEDYVFIPDEAVESVPWYGVSKTTEVDGQTVTQNYFYQYAPGGVFDHYATEAEATITQQDGSLVLKEGYIGNVMEPGGSSKTVTYDGVEYTGYTQASTTIHVKAEEDWSIANIPLGTVVTVSEPEKAGYTFVNAKLNGDAIQTTKSEDGTHTTVGTTIPAGTQSTIKITNKELPLDMLLFKAELVDEQDVLLGGAQFSLFKWDETASTWLNASGVTNPFAVDKVTGRLIQDIRPGLYKLQENKAPDGYITTQDTYFKVVDRKIFLCDENGNTTTGSGDDAVPYVNEMAKIETTDNIAKLKLTVYNTPGAALPNSGGPGTTWIYLIGSLLLLGCGIALVSRRRIQKN